MLETSSRLGPYEIVGPLGAGGMGEVYRARDTRLGREVAVKVLAERFAGDAELRGRFEREAQGVAVDCLDAGGRQEGADDERRSLVDGEDVIPPGFVDLKKVAFSID